MASFGLHALSVFGNPFFAARSLAIMKAALCKIVSVVPTFVILDAVCPEQQLGVLLKNDGLGDEDSGLLMLFLVLLRIAFFLLRLAT